MKKMIALLPCLEGAGGIRVLLGFFEELQQLGYQIEIWSQLEGSFRCRFEEMGIPVQIQQDMLDDAFMTYRLGASKNGIWVYFFDFLHPSLKAAWNKALPSYHFYH